MSEMPLVFFTVLSQMAAGAFIVFYRMEQTQSVDPAASRRIAFGIAGSMAVALLMSTAHLGHPQEGYRALFNLGSSWLSREILVSSLFFFCTLLYCWPQAKRAAAQWIGLVGAVSGILMIFITGMVYSLPSHPAWSGVYPVAFFALTAIVAGPLFTFMLSGGKYFGGKDRAILMTGIVLSALWFALYAAIGTEVFIGAFDAGLRLVVGVLIPIIILLKCQKQHVNYLPIVWGFVLCGEIFGRMLFYAGTHMMPMFGM